MEYTYKQIQDYFFNNNLHASDTIYNDMDSIAHVLCEVLTSSEKARAKKAVKNGGFFTFGYSGTLKQKKSVWYDLVGSEFEFE